MKVWKVLRDTGIDRVDVMKVEEKDHISYLLRYVQFPVGAKIATVQEIPLEIHEMAELLELMLDEIDSWRKAA